jgi:hypothetical protein
MVEKCRESVTCQTMKRTYLSAVGTILLPWLAAMTVTAAEVKQVAEDSDTPNAVVLSIHGKCEYSEDGVHFTELNSEHVFIQGVAVRSGNVSAGPKSQFAFNQGAVVRTGEDSRVDIFFRRIGTTVRLQPNTEVKLEKMSRSTKNGVPVLETLVDLRKGRIFTVVRSLIAGSTFEIRNAAGRSVVEGAPTGGMGRYIITADGTQVTHSTSVLPLKLIDEKGITIISPGQQFDIKEGKMLPMATPETVKTLIEFDELHALLEGASGPAAQKQLSKP